jgi:SAM-dependent methyltransferase
VISTLTRVFGRAERSYDGDQRALDEHQHDWDELATLDPLWAIRSKRTHKFGRWDINEFFADGASEVEHLVGCARTLGYPREWGSVLDFGCGVGRLAPALSSCFDEYWGLDVSNEMIARARDLHRQRPNCQFVVSQEAGFDRFAPGSFDLVVSLYVLQHLTDSSLILSYIQDLAGLVRPGGLLVLQLPDRIPRAEKLFYDARRNLFRFLSHMSVSRTLIFRRFGLFPMTMNFLPEATVLTALGTQKVNLLRIDSERRGIAVRDRTYYATPTP